MMRALKRWLAHKCLDYLAETPEETRVRLRREEWLSRRPRSNPRRIDRNRPADVVSGVSDTRVIFIGRPDAPPEVRH